MIQMTVSAPPRGGGEQAEQVFPCQSMRGSFAWGGSPATATLTYVGGDAPVTQGALVSFQVGRHYFAGICASDTLFIGSSGNLRVLEFQDLRKFLTYDWVFGAFNLADVRLTNGVRKKRYKHMYPADVATYTWTFTDAPLQAWQILAAVFGAPTVFTRWAYDLTSNGMFPAGLMNCPIYGLDLRTGVRLDSFLNQVSELTGLVFCHDPRPLQDFRLVWTRKGYGWMPLPFPANSDNRRLGISMTDNATNICVAGGRNQYQFLEVPLVKDWSPAWEQFIEVDLLAKDIFDNEVNPLTGVRYNAYADDPEQWQGAGDAKARALEITVAQYVQLRNARSAGTGNDFIDNRKFGGRWRMDMPAALYLEMLVFRAFRPSWTYVTNADGHAVPLTSADIASAMLARTLYDPLTGAMSVDSPPQPVDGNGLLIAKGYQVGEDLFRLVQPGRMNEAFFSAANRVWSSVGFQIDDSGEGTRFIIADAPVFVSDNLLTTVDGKVMLNAAATLAVPDVKAALVFQCEPYMYWRGWQGGWNGRPKAIDPSVPLPGKNRVESVNELAMDFVVDAAGHYTELPFADNFYADDKAKLIADTLLLCQPAYYSGGYELKWDPVKALAEFGTSLAPSNSSCLDRLEISVGPSGVMEVVDFTTERQRETFEPERELERRTIQNTLFPGQQELRVRAEDQKRFNAVLRKTPERLFGLFRKLLRGEVSEDLYPVKFVPSASLPATLPVGTPLWRTPTAGVVTAPAGVVSDTDKVFVGVTVRHNEPTGGGMYVQNKGEAQVRVMGPVNVGDAVGPSAGGTDFATNGAYLKAGTGVGVALEANNTQINDASGNAPGAPGYVPTYPVKLLRVRLGAGSGGGGAKTYAGAGAPSATTLPAGVNFTAYDTTQGVYADYYQDISVTPTVMYVCAEPGDRTTAAWVKTAWPGDPMVQVNGSTGVMRWNYPGMPGGAVPALFDPAAANVNGAVRGLTVTKVKISNQVTKGDGSTACDQWTMLVFGSGKFKDVDDPPTPT